MVIGSKPHPRSDRNPASVALARALLVELGAPARLLRHVELVGEAGELLVGALAAQSVAIDDDLVRIGIVLHDAGKILHPAELERVGADHEPAGEALLLKHGVTAELARICVSHARWSSIEVSLEELVIALADTLWKGVRKPTIEERVIDEVARRSAKERWALFIALDNTFENIAADGAARLERSRT